MIICLEFVSYWFWIPLGMGYETIAIALFDHVTTVFAMYRCLSLMPTIDWTINKTGVYYIKPIFFFLLLSELEKLFNARESI